MSTRGSPVISGSAEQSSKTTALGNVMKSSINGEGLMIVMRCTQESTPSIAPVSVTINFLSINPIPHSFVESVMIDSILSSPPQVETISTDPKIERSLTSLLHDTMVSEGHIISGTSLAVTSTSISPTFEFPDPSVTVT